MMALPCHLGVFGPANPGSFFVKRPSKYPPVVRLYGESIFEAILRTAHCERSLRRAAAQSALAAAQVRSRTGHTNTTKPAHQGPHKANQ